MSDQLFIGIDSGTQGTKGVVFSRQEGRILAEAYTDHQLIENIGGRREQKPEWWIEACSTVIGQLLKQNNVSRDLIRAIGVSGQQQLTDRRVGQLDAAAGVVDLLVHDGVGVGAALVAHRASDATVTIDFTTVVDPGDYLGPGADEVRLLWRVWTSTDGWDDVDCISPSHGACQIDDLAGLRRHWRQDAQGLQRDYRHGLGFSGAGKWDREPGH